MRNFFINPFISSPGKFLARISYGALWGVLLSDAPDDVRILYGCLLGLPALFLSGAFVGWDAHNPLDASRMALYGLVVLGEVLCVGAVVLAALGAILMAPEFAYAAAVGAFGGYFVSFYGVLSLYKRNIAERRGSNQ